MSLIAVLDDGMNHFMSMKCCVRCGGNSGGFADMMGIVTGGQGSP